MTPGRPSSPCEWVPAPPGGRRAQLTPGGDPARWPPRRAERTGAGAAGRAGGKVCSLWEGAGRRARGSGAPRGGGGGGRWQPRGWGVPCGRRPAHAHPGQTGAGPAASTRPTARVGGLGRAGAPGGQCPWQPGAARPPPRSPAPAAPRPPPSPAGLAPAGRRRQRRRPRGGVPGGPARCGAGTAGEGPRQAPRRAALAERRPRRRPGRAGRSAAGPMPAGGGRGGGGSLPDPALAPSPSAAAAAAAAHSPAARRGTMTCSIRAPPPLFRVSAAPAAPRRRQGARQGRAPHAPPPPPPRGRRTRGAARS